MTRAFVPALLAVLFVLAAVFYLIPGVTHALVSDSPTAIHVKHAILFAGLAVLSLVWARFAANATR